MDNFERNLRQIINRFGLDSRAGIPDFVFAQIINEMLEEITKKKTKDIQIPTTEQDWSNVRKEIISVMMAALSDMSMVD